MLPDNSKQLDASYECPSISPLLSTIYPSSSIYQIIYLFVSMF